MADLNFLNNKQNQKYPQFVTIYGTLDSIIFISYPYKA